MPAAKLDILANRFPKAHYFRSTEGVNQYENYAEWAAEFDALQGVQGKALAEEKSDRNLKHIRYYSRFKADHPEQMVLLHFNGNARDPEFETGDFFAGHWLYTNGAKVLSDVPDDFNGVHEVQVSDTNIFTLWTGRFFDRGEDLGLCDLDADGKPDWSRSEQVQLVGIDHEKQTISIRRGCHGTRPIGFAAEKSYIAPHIVEGPWNGRQNNLMWFYNYSTRCPRDAQGRTCADVLADWLTHTFGPEGLLAAFDGLEFDVLFSSLYNHPYYYLQGIKPHGHKQADCDADGVGDTGIFDGVDTYGVGVLELCRKLRSQMGQDKLILADAGWWHGQRSFHLLNGIESEGLEIDDDGHCQWGHALNTHLYWNANSREPVLNYILLTKRHPKMTDGATRIAMAIAVLSGSAIAVGTRTCGRKKLAGPAGATPEDWDELVNAGQDGPGWLGEPLGPMVRPVMDTPDLLEADGDTPGQALMDRVEMIAGQASIDGQSLKLTTDPNGKINMRLRGLAPDGPNLVVAMNARGRNIEAYPAEGHRLMYLTATREGRAVVDEEIRFGTKKRRHAYFVDGSFTNTWSYNDLPSGPIDLDWQFEGDGPVWIDRLRAWAGIDVGYREFQNGLVVVNPSKQPCTLEMHKWFPDRKFRRIQGRPGQCPDANNGQPVSEKLELPVHDALFLVAL